MPHVTYCVEWSDDDGREFVEDHRDKRDAAMRRARKVSDKWGSAYVVAYATHSRDDVVSIGQAHYWNGARSSVDGSLTWKDSA